MNALDTFYSKILESEKSCILALKHSILNQDTEITTCIKYGMPFFAYKGKLFCYLWIKKKERIPYIGFMEGKYFDEEYMLQEKRSRIKIMLIDSNKDLPIKKIERAVQKAIHLYKNGIIGIKK